MGSVVVVGSINEDLIVQLQRTPRPGETVVGHSLRRSCGGKGANQAVAAARAGAAVRMFGAVGDDEAGRRLRAALVAEGVDVSSVATVAEPTGVALVLLQDDGENAIAVIPGANQALALTHLAESGLNLSADDVVVTQGEISPGTILHVAALAERASARFVLNLAPVIELDVRRAPVDVLVVNEHEAGLLVGADTGDARALATRLHQISGGAVVVTLGARGAILMEAGRSVHIDPAEATAVIDTTGAGDAFVGALAAALAEGHDVARAAHWGTIAGAIAVSRMGAQGASASRGDIASALQARGLTA